MLVKFNKNEELKYHRRTGSYPKLLVSTAYTGLLRKGKPKTDRQVVVPSCWYPRPVSMNKEMRTQWTFLAKFWQKLAKNKTKFFAGLTQKSEWKNINHSQSYKPLNEGHFRKNATWDIAVFVYFGGFYGIKWLIWVWFTFKLVCSSISMLMMGKTNLKSTS